VLLAMGVAHALSGVVDSSSVDGQRRLSISHVLHKGFVDVNEQGTGTAAVTGIIMKVSASLFFGPTIPSHS